MMPFFYSSHNNNSIIPHPGNVSFWIVIMMCTYFTSGYLIGLIDDTAWYEPYISQYQKESDNQGGLTSDSLLESNFILFVSVRWILTLIPYAFLGIVGWSIVVRARRQKNKGSG